MAITATKRRSIIATNAAPQTQPGAPQFSPPLQTSGRQAPYEFVVMAFVNVNSPGLLILPTHRVVHSLTSFSARLFANQPGPSLTWRK